LQYASLDFKIINGTDLFDNWMIAIISAHGLLRANVPVMPRPGQWEHYQFPLSPADFGVTPETFDAIMRDVVMLGVRSEWVAGDEKEALDNVRLSKAPDAYWAWIVNFFGGADLADELIIGKLADPDGDGVNNWDEFTADTAPNNQLDCLRLQIIAAPKAVCRLQFDSRPGRLYSVEYTATLPPESSWMALASDLPGTGSPLTLEDTAAEPGRFYRLRARLGP
jgi:hypothetical protein